MKDAALGVLHERLLSIVNERTAADEAEGQVHRVVKPARVGRVTEGFEVALSTGPVRLSHRCGGLVEAPLLTALERARAQREFVRTIGTEPVAAVVAKLRATKGRRSQLRSERCLLRQVVAVTQLGGQQHQVVRVEAAAGAAAAAGELRRKCEG